MIKLNDIDGRAVYLKEDSIAAIQDKPGYYTNAIVYVDSGNHYEVKQTAAQIYKMIEETKLLRKD